MNYFIITFLFLNYFSSTVHCLDLPQGFLDRPLLPGQSYHCCKNEPYLTNRDLPVVYCYLGSPKRVLNIWQTISALIDLNSDQYMLFEGYNINDVYEQFEAHRSSWSLLNLVNFRHKEIQLDPFNKTCLGIQTNYDYSIKLKVTDVDYIRVGVFSFGVLLFFLAPVLANNPLFYYLTSITVGVCASVLILFYFFVKILPLKKPAMIGMVAGGSTIAFYLFQTFYDNIFLLVFKYQEYVIGYLLISALVSFIVCYRFGPVSNSRSINLIKWTMQAFALIMIFLSSHLREVTLLSDVIILFFYNIPILRWIAGIARFSKGLMFPSRPHPRLLSKDEFQEQAKVETKRSLEQLRAYCNSPECKHWQTVLRLRNPHRFAKFIEGKSHITREEVELYEEDDKEMMNLIFTDDDSESGED